MDEIQEYQLLPPAEGLIGRRASLKLSDSDRVLLVNWVRSAEYGIFLRLAEGIIEIDETKHFKVWADKEAFDRTGLIAVAERLFFERIQKEANNQLEEFHGELEFLRKEKSAQNASPEELVQRSFT